MLHRLALLLLTLGPLVAVGCATPVGVRRVNERSVHRTLTASVISVGAILALPLTLSCLLLVVPPLGISMDNLLVRNQVHRSLTVETRALLLADRDVRFTNLNVGIAQGAAFVRADIVAAPGLLTQETVNSIRDKISEGLEMPVTLEFSIIPETILRSSEDGGN